MTDFHYTVYVLIVFRTSILRIKKSYRRRDGRSQGHEKISPFNVILLQQQIIKYRNSYCIVTISVKYLLLSHSSDNNESAINTVVPVGHGAFVICDCHATTPPTKSFYHLLVSYAVLLSTTLNIMLSITAVLLYFYRNINPKEI